MEERDLLAHIDRTCAELMEEFRSLRDLVTEFVSRVAVIEARCQERCALVARKNGGNGSSAFLKKEWPLIWRVALLAALLVAIGLGGVDMATTIIPKLIGGGG